MNERLLAVAAICAMTPARLAPSLLRIIVPAKKMEYGRREGSHVAGVVAGEVELEGGHVRNGDGLPPLFHKWSRFATTM